MRKVKPIAARFFEKVKKPDGAGCWEWLSSKDRENGYGSFHVTEDGRRKTKKAHRVSWEIHKGAIPEGMWVLHTCDNPQCSNPDHLFLGDRKDNMLDCASKGRVKTVGKSNITHCPKGHEYTEENTKVKPNGHRMCRACLPIKAKERWARHLKKVNAVALDFSGKELSK